jgi:hypothetical protein
LFTDGEAQGWVKLNPANPPWLMTLQRKKQSRAGAHRGKVLDDDKAYCCYFIPPLSPASNLGQCEKVAGPINKWCRLFARGAQPMIHC